MSSCPGISDISEGTPKSERWLTGAFERSYQNPLHYFVTRQKRGWPLIETGLASRSGSCSWKLPGVGRKKNPPRCPRSPSSELGLELKQQGSFSSCHWLVMLPWASYLTSLSLRFPQLWSSDYSYLEECRKDRRWPVWRARIVSHTFGLYFKEKHHMSNDWFFPQQSNMYLENLQTIQYFIQGDDEFFVIRR